MRDDKEIAIETLRRKDLHRETTGVIPSSELSVCDENKAISRH
jgi:hypothetical protein